MSRVIRVNYKLVMYASNKGVTQEEIAKEWRLPISAFHRMMADPLSELDQMKYREIVDRISNNREN